MSPGTGATIFSKKTFTKAKIIVSALSMPPAISFMLKRYLLSIWNSNLNSNCLIFYWESSLGPPCWGLKDLLSESSLPSEGTVSKPAGGLASSLKVRMSNRKKINQQLQWQERLVLQVCGKHQVSGCQLGAKQGRGGPVWADGAARAKAKLSGGSACGVSRNPKARLGSIKEEKVYSSQLM